MEKIIRQEDLAILKMQMMQDKEKERRTSKV